jgi:hypothetical protein
MAADCLTQVEKDSLRGIYRRDVKFWENWGPTVKVAKREGVCPLGLSWVVLCYKAGPELPFIRREMNDLYLQCLQEYAEQYDLSVCLDPAIQKVIVYDPERASSDWLENMMLPGHTGRCE